MTENAENISFNSPRSRKDKRGSIFMALSPMKTTKIEVDKPVTPQGKETHSLDTPSKEMLKSKSKMREMIQHMYQRNNALEEMQIEYTKEIQEMKIKMALLEQENNRLYNENVETKSNLTSLANELSTLKKLQEDIAKDRWRNFCSKN